jgi:hypothetical protein
MEPKHKSRTARLARLCCWCWTLAAVKVLAQPYLFNTIGGSPGVLGITDGTNAAALFNSPYGIAVDASRAVYIADIFNNTIRKLTPMGTNWIVRTIAGAAQGAGASDGTNGTPGQMSKPSLRNTARISKGCLPPVIAAAVKAWWSGPSTKAAAPPANATAT